MHIEDVFFILHRLEEAIVFSAFKIQFVFFYADDHVLERQSFKFVLTNMEKGLDVSEAGVGVCAEACKADRLTKMSNRERAFIINKLGLEINLRFVRITLFKTSAHPKPRKNYEVQSPDLKQIRPVVCSFLCKSLCLSRNCPRH